jgi:hypothetical protein
MKMSVHGSGAASPSQGSKVSYVFVFTLSMLSAAAVFAQLPPGEILIDLPQKIPIGDHTNVSTSITLRSIKLEYRAAPADAIVTVLPKTTVRLSMPIADAEIASVKWYKDQRELGWLGTTLILESVAPQDVGSYTAIVRLAAPGAGNPDYQFFETIRLRVEPAGALAFLNLSSRTFLSTSNPQLIGGFVIGAASDQAVKTVLIRAVGRSLARFGVSSPLATPRLRVFDAAGADVTQALAAAYLGAGAASLTRAVGAFPLSPDTEDVEVYLSLPPGAYTAQIESADGGSGNVLLELYEIPPEALSVPVLVVTSPTPQT